MNAKKIILLAAVLLILGILYYGIEDPRKTGAPAEPKAFVPDFDRTAAARIAITPRDGVPVVLTRGQAGWQVGADNSTWPADGGPVDALLANLAGLTVDTVASRNPRNFDAFEVTGTTGVQVTITGAEGTRLADFIVGKSGPDIFSTYIRSVDSDSVVLVGGILKTIYDRPVNEWRDKTLFSAAGSAPVEYRITGDMTLHLRRGDDGAWRVLAPEAFVPEPSAVDNALRQFTGLKAADIADDNATVTGLDAPVRTITAYFAEAPALALRVGQAKNAFQTFVRPDHSDQAYILENHALEAVCPALEALRPPAEPAAGDDRVAAPDNATGVRAPDAAVQAEMSGGSGADTP
jgi:hypothetical protein